MRTSLENLLAEGTPIIADGGMGTFLFELGLEHGDSPELWNVEYPDRIRHVHHEYIQAGAQIILTNTFGCNRLRLGLHDLSERVVELNLAAAQIVCDEAEQADQPVVAAGSIGPTGSIMMPYGDLEFDSAVEVFEEQARALLEGGVDVFWIETISDLEEVRAAVEGCRRASADHPIVATMTFDTKGYTMMGVSPEKAIETISEMGVMAVGGNCGNGTAEIENVIAKMHATNPGAALVAKSNAGIPQLINNNAVYDATPDDMAAHAKTILNLGAVIIGGCCGSTPDHIRAIAGAIR